MFDAKTATRTPRIGPRSAGIPMTHEEFDDLPEDRWVEGYRYELINGVLVVTPPPDAGERGPNDDLGFLFRHFQQIHPQGGVLDETLPEQTVPTTPNRRRCDRAVWVGLGRTPDLAQDIPAIVVEFVSASRRDVIRDYETKRDEYRRFGVREYWVIDRFRRRMIVYRFHAGREQADEVIVAEDGTYQTDLLPGFVLTLARTLSKADLWPKQKRPRKPPRGGAR